jgi:hypothetical protein
MKAQLIFGTFLSTNLYALKWLTDWFLRVGSGPAIATSAAEEVLK